MVTKKTKEYDFKCEVVHYGNTEPIIVNKHIYRSDYVEFYQGTKTTKAEFKILPFGKKYMAYVFLIDDNKKKQSKNEFRGNLLWGFGKTLSLEKLKEKINNYTNSDQVKKDFDL